jgi:hypothetical protein
MSRSSTNATISHARTVVGPQAPRLIWLKRLWGGSGQVLDMTAIIQFIEKAGFAGVFDDHATKVMGEAFDAACKDLHDTGQPSVVYEVVATRIIEAAKSGERDPEKLRDWALTAFGGKQG